MFLYYPIQLSGGMQTYKSGSQLYLEILAIIDIFKI